MTEERKQEAREVGALLTLALSILGAVAVQSTFDRWLQVSALGVGQAVPRGVRFAAEAVARMRPRRRAARDLAVAAYRLIMALRTGVTLSIEGEHEGGGTTLQQLRQEFHDAVQEHAPAALLSDEEPPTPTSVPEEALRRSTGRTEAPSGTPEGEEVLWEEPEVIPLWDVSNWSDTDADIEAELIRIAEEEAAELAEQERLFEEAMRQVAAAEYRELLKAKQEEAIRKQEDQDAAREEQRQTQGRKLAAIEAMNVRNGARRVEEHLLEKDSKVTGVARYSPNGCCAFCGVLILNGPHYKKPFPQLKVHPNCDCEWVGLYLPSDYEDTRFDWNRYLKDLYRDVKNNKSKRENSNEGLNALRRALYQRRKLARS